MDMNFISIKNMKWTFSSSYKLFYFQVGALGSVNKAHRAPPRSVNKAHGAPFWCQSPASLNILTPTPSAFRLPSRAALFEISGEVCDENPSTAGRHHRSPGRGVGCCQYFSGRCNEEFRGAPMGLHWGEMERQKYAISCHCLGYFYGKYFSITDLKDPGNYSDQFWFL